MTLDKAQQLTEFDMFWDAYPRKVKKRLAERTWYKVNPPIKECLEALAWQTHQDQWTKDCGKFIPHPSTWINDGQWEDEKPGDKAPAMTPEQMIARVAQLETELGTEPN